MLNMKYCYEFQKKRYEYFWNMSLAIKDDLQYKELANAYALPPKNTSIIDNGGIVDKNMNLVSEANMEQYNGSIIFGNGYDFAPASAEVLEGQYIYLGAIMDHWGHFLVDSCTRLYYLLEHPESKGIFLIPQKISNFRLNKNILRFFELLNISEDRIVFLNKVSKVEHLYIPQQAYVSGKYTSIQYMATFRQVMDNINPTCSDIYEKVYFSRSNFNKILGKEIGLELIDDIFCSAGFKKFYPEEESLDSQIFYLNTCNEFAGISGTVIHNLIFAQNKLKTIYVINKTYYLIPQLFESCKMAHGMETIFLDFFASKYPVHIGFGPFIFLTNEYVIRFLSDYNIQVKHKEYFTESYNRYNCDMYELLYYKIKDKRKLRSYISQKWQDVNYLDALFIQDWVNKYNNKLEYPPYFFKEYNSYSEIIQVHDKLKRMVRQLLNSKQNNLLVYQLHLSMVGWVDETINGFTSGLPNKNYAVEALKIRFQNGNAAVFYQAYYNDSGWDTVCRNGQQSGTTGQAKPIEGIKIWLGDLAYDYHIEYRIYIDDWTDWVRDGHQLVAQNGFKAIEIQLAAR